MLVNKEKAMGWLGEMIVEKSPTGREEHRCCYTGITDPGLVMTCLRHPDVDIIVIWTGLNA